MWLIERVKVLKNKNKVTFEKIANEWLKLKEKEIKKSTYSNYKYSINKYLMPKLRKCTLKALEKYNFIELVDELNQEYAPKTVRDILSKLKAILYYAQDEYGIEIKTKKNSYSKTWYRASCNFK